MLIRWVRYLHFLSWSKLPLELSKISSSDSKILYLPRKQLQFLFLALNSTIIAALVNYFVRLRTSHYTLLTISPVSFIFDCVRNLTRNLLYRPLDVSWKYRSLGDNDEMRNEKNDWRDGLQNAIYTLLLSLASTTFFRILINLTISV